MERPKSTDIILRRTVALQAGADPVAPDTRESVAPPSERHFGIVVRLRASPGKKRNDHGAGKVVEIVGRLFQ